jgi:hypothetical protein
MVFHLKYDSLFLTHYLAQSFFGYSGCAFSLAEQRPFEAEVFQLLDSIWVHEDFSRLHLSLLLPLVVDRSTEGLVLLPIHSLV